MSVLARGKTFRALVGLDAVLAALLAVQVGSFLAYRRSVATPLARGTTAAPGRRDEAARPDLASYKVIDECALFGTAPTAAPRQEAPGPLVLKGVLGDKALLYSEATRKEALVEVGGSFEGATVTKIELDRVCVERDGKVEELKLFGPKPGAKPSAEPDRTPDRSPARGTRGARPPSGRSQNTREGQ